MTLMVGWGGGHIASHDPESYAVGSIATVKSCPCQSKKQFTILMVRGVLTQEQAYTKAPIKHPIIQGSS